MDRRDFLKNTGGVAASLGVTIPAGAALVAANDDHAAPGLQAAPHLGSNVRELTMSVSAADNARGEGESARRLARRLGEMSGGRLSVQILPGSDRAHADLRHGAAFEQGTSSPALAFFAGLPGRSGVSAADLDAWLAIGGGQDLWDELAAEHGYRPMLAGHSGANPALWSRRLVRTSADFQGLNFAGGALASDVAQGLGAQCVKLKGDEATAAFKTHQIDAYEGPGAVYSMAAGLPVIAPFALSGGINRNGLAQSLAVRLELWSKLSASDRSLIESACAEEFRLVNAEARVHEALAWKVMQHRHGLKLSQQSVELAGAIDRVAEAVVAHVAGSSLQARRINASYMAFKAMLPSPPVA